MKLTPQTPTFGSCLPSPSSAQRLVLFSSSGFRAGYVLLKARFFAHNTRIFNFCSLVCNSKPEIRTKLLWIPRFFVLPLGRSRPLRPSTSATSTTSTSASSTSTTQTSTTSTSTSSTTSLTTSSTTSETTSSTTSTTSTTSDTTISSTSTSSSTSSSTPTPTPTSSEVTTTDASGQTRTIVTVIMAEPSSTRGIAPSATSKNDNGGSGVSAAAHYLVLVQSPMLHFGRYA
ncbi:hypothetical protein VKT23_020187 [Stygiomarasmius scandens]|uniref:Uncharacterized protein n=1 Tax=Marasmiellus scandens TaxID=2682957 RepID=A0ABR1IJI5_9AGAR